MKKLITFALATACCLSVSGGTVKAYADSPEKTNCKASYVCDAESGTVISAENETKRLPIASMCKIMTLLLSFEAVDDGQLSFEEEITVSENASGMGGSQVFLGTGLVYNAEQLMKTVAVCSANDSCVALAERVAGSESAFVERMNARAKALGAENTLFANCTGLPKEPQYSCAKDVSLMLRELIKHQKYFEFSKVWLEDFAHPDGRTTQITNTNKLTRFYEGCDGGKTGITNEAGFCLAATAKRNDMRLISVVIGADSSKGRFNLIRKSFDYGFSAYENAVLLKAGEKATTVPVKGSRTQVADLCAEHDLSAFSKKGETGNLTVEYSVPECVKAPLKEGDRVGEAILYRDGVEIARVAICSMQTAERFSWWDALQESARNWN